MFKDNKKKTDSKRQNIMTDTFLIGKQEAGRKSYRQKSVKKLSE